MSKPISCAYAFQSDSDPAHPSTSRLNPMKSKALRTMIHILTALGLWSIAWFATVQPVAFCVNLFAFLTWFCAAVSILARTQERSRAKLLETHLAGHHAPAWFDAITYAPIIVLCAGVAHYWLAVAWCVTTFNDFGSRYAANEERKRREANAPHN